MVEEASKEKQKLEDSKESAANKLSEGALCGEFYVGEEKKVRFSKGNLQFNAVQGTHKTADGKELPGTWRFAEHQWDTIGEGNNNISENYDGWIDLFRWGTSGWDSGAKCYQPWSVYDKNKSDQPWDDYFSSGERINHLTEAFVKCDWGVYNAISNGGDAPEQWRTLTAQEWYYLLKHNKWSVVTIDRKLCFLLIPENVSGLLEVSTGDEKISYFKMSDFESNTLTVEQFKRYEEQGVVALPFGGVRGPKSSYGDGGVAYYWSVSSSDDYAKYAKGFRLKRVEHGLEDGGFILFQCGCSVRLVQNVEYKRKAESPIKRVASTLCEGAICGEFYIGENKKVRFSKGNLQFNAVQGTHKTADGKELPGVWRFAEHQWDIIGNNNEKTSKTYDGFVDLFGWGTSGWNSGAKYYQPWSWFPEKGYGRDSYNLTGVCENADWGRYNAISNGGDEPGKWRVLKDLEWRYLKKHNRWSMGTIDGMMCFLLIPEKVTDLVVLSDIGDEYHFDKSYFKEKKYESNTFTAEQFKKFEDQGVVALPCGGGRYGTSVGYVGSYGGYWSSSVNNVDLDDACEFCFGSTDGIFHYNFYRRSHGKSVRLVQDVL